MPVTSHHALRFSAPIKFLKSLDPRTPVILGTRGTAGRIDARFGRRDEPVAALVGRFDIHSGSSGSFSLSCSEMPIAIACFGFVTTLPLEEPLWSCPCLNSFITPRI